MMIVAKERREELLTEGYHATQRDTDDVQLTLTSPTKIIYQGENILRHGTRPA
jgi:hypothetical protein